MTRGVNHRNSHLSPLRRKTKSKAVTSHLYSFCAVIVNSTLNMEGDMKSRINIGVWMSDKKSQKLNWKELNKACITRGCTLVKIDLDKPLEDQGTFHVLLHKLTDIIAAADQGDEKAVCIIRRVEQYLSNNPNVVVIDPLDKVRILLNRNWYYSILENEQSFKFHGIFTPAFAEFTTNNLALNYEIMRKKGVKFPVICKQTLAHGVKSAHEMVVIFNKNGLKVCKPPCVVQSFVNHNAVLHKVYIVGNRYCICERPSLKNFYASDDSEPIFYNTSEVCKADSQSTLSILDPHDQTCSDIKMPLDESRIKHIIKVFKEEIGLLLVGIDVVIDNVTGDHAVIDINVYPSYDNFPNFFGHLLDCIDEACHRGRHNDQINGTYKDICEHSLTNMLNGIVNVGLTRGNAVFKGSNLGN